MAAPAPATIGLIDELEDAMSHGPVGRRVTALRRITDLFLLAASSISDEQLQLFDDVFLHLVRTMEASARITLSQRLAPCAETPPGILRRLAFADDIAVAAPMLTQSPKLSDEMLCEIAGSQSQNHMLAISARPSLSAAVTDILVIRGDRAVATAVVGNGGAAFSQKGLDRLIMRAQDDADLAISLGRRPDLSRHHLLQLISKASETVRRRLLQEFKSAEAGAIGHAVQCAAAAQHTASTNDAGVRTAMAQMQELHARNALDRATIIHLARGGQFERLCAAMAQLTKASYSEVEAAMMDNGPDAVLVLGRAADLSWDAMQAIFTMRAQLLGRRLADEPQARASFLRLRPTTAQQVLRFKKMQDDADAP